MRIFFLMIAALGQIYGSTILDGVFRWDSTGLVSGSFVGRNQVSDAQRNPFAFINIRNEDSTYCVLDSWTCNLAGDYHPTIATYRGNLRPDLFFTAGLWDMNFQHFDYSAWTAPRKVITVPFQMFADMTFLSGMPARTQFTLSQGLKGRATLTILGGPGQYYIDSADFDIVNNPEPATLVLIGSGLAALGLYRRRTRCSQSN